MTIQQIRNATVTVEYGGQKFLIDPMFSKKGAFESFGPAERDDRNPIVELPMAVEEILEGVDAVIVTHTHEDHFDDAAKEQLPKDMKLFMQDEADAEMAKESGFTNVEVMEEGVGIGFNDIELTEVDGRHGYGEMAKAMGNVMGLVFQHPEEKTLYLAGDTVWYEEVQENIDVYKPEVIILNGGQNQFLEGGPLIMGKEDIYEVFKAAPEADIVVSHMEAVNHWGLSREELKNFINEKEMESNVVVPDDGEAYSY
ncbi:MBL fold metallo-hydrolase [Planococcus shenhongbingii]|uniref:MBL fold metallo-hydrolase n=1 Tax=Planococcus shenhongbingii TaxID=3058398 RepID=A0ABT8N822_9BACL|nr:MULTISPECIES: MBL fold metallo-hydrolase [unclassified Planococcus (in: firmicutes)]MDN7243874.1 MBL fold metallo-hydrolase [Planococcus sp. N017]WKA60476.1 MBL fold metallo-hydrolase [Planococcus sp. N016]